MIAARSTQTRGGKSDRICWLVCLQLTMQIQALKTSSMLADGLWIHFIRIYTFTKEKKYTKKKQKKEEAAAFMPGEPEALKDHK